MRGSGVGSVRAQPPEAAPTASLSGHAEEEGTGRAAAGVSVSIFSGGQAVAQARTDEAGDFRASGLPLAAPGSRAGSLVLVARLKGFAPALALAPARFHRARPRSHQDQPAVTHCSTPIRFHPLTLFGRLELCGLKAGKKRPPST